MSAPGDGHARGVAFVALGLCLDGAASAAMVVLGFVYPVADLCFDIAELVARRKGDGA